MKPWKGKIEWVETTLKKGAKSPDPKWINARYVVHVILWHPKKRRWVKDTLHSRREVKKFLQQAKK